MVEGNQWKPLWIEQNPPAGAEGFATSPTRRFCDTPPQQKALVGVEAFATQTLPSNPRSADPSDNPSARSRAVDQNPVSEGVSEVRSVAALPHIHGRESDKQTYTPHHDVHSRVWVEAGEFFNSIWPSKPVRDEDVDLLLDLAKECCHGDLVRGGERLKAAWEWNQIHKKGKWKLFSLAELAKALGSPNDRSLLAQMDADEGCPLCMEKCPVCEGYTDCPCRRVKSTPMAQPSIAPTTSQPPPVELPVVPQREMITCTDCKGEFDSPVGKGWPNRRPFCSEDCRKNFDVRQEELRQKYARPKEKGLAAFLEG